MLRKLVGWIVQGVLEYLDLWIERERREAAESKVRALKGQLRSIKLSKAAELRINKPITITRDLAVPSPLEWNRGAR